MRKRHTIETDYCLEDFYPNQYNILTTIPEKKTKGPKGPRVAHLRKRSKVTVEPFTEDH